MPEDPFAKAKAIRAGEVEMPSYDELTGYIQRCPKTWLPALLIRVVQQCQAHQVFQPGGLERVVKNTVEKGGIESCLRANAELTGDDLLKRIGTLANTGMVNDGEHHKQWCLAMILKEVNPEKYKEFEDYGGDVGVAP